MFCQEVFRIAVIMRVALPALFVFFLLLPVPAAATGLYSVETWDVLPPGGNAVYTLPVQWWEVPPFALLCCAVCTVCPLLGPSAELLYILGLWCTFGFRRAQHNSLLAHPLRADIYHYIRMNPGTPFSVIAQQNGINRGTLHYHLYILLREGKISERKEGGRTTYFENDGRYSTDEKKILSRLRSGTGGDICRYLAAHHGATRSEIAQWVGIAPSSVSWHLSRLKESGIVISETEGRKTLFRLTSGAFALLPACAPDILSESHERACI